MTFPPKTAVLEELRRSLGDTVNPEWIEEALAAAAAVPIRDDDHVCDYLNAALAAAQAVLWARIAAQEARTRELNEQTDARIATAAAIAAYEKQSDLGTIH